MALHNSDGRSGVCKKGDLYLCAVFWRLCIFDNFMAYVSIITYIVLRGGTEPMS